MYPNCNLGSGYGTFTPYPFPTVPTAFQPQQQLPTYTKPGLAGRVVNKLDDILPNEVPMDGTSSLFPLQDESAIFVKSWNADGTIRTVKYLREVTDIPKKKPSDPIEELKNYIDERFNKLEASYKEVMISG